MNQENKYSAVFYKENNQIYCTVKRIGRKVVSFCQKMEVNGKEVNIDTKKNKKNKMKN